MPSITSLDKPALRLIRADIDAALAAVAAKHGISIRLGGASFTAANASFKLEVATIGDGGVPVTKETQALQAYARFNYIGLKTEHLTQEFNLGTKTFVLHGYNHRAPARPFLLRQLSDGKIFVARNEDIIRGLKLAPADHPLLAPEYRNAAGNDFPGV